MLQDDVQDDAPRAAFGATLLRRPDAQGDAHSTCRIFIGPMPQTVEGEDQEEEQASNFVAVHGLHIYLRQGGRIEDWTEVKAREFKQRLKERILESAARYYAVSKSKRRRKNAMPSTEWMGESFEVGNVVGISVNMLAVHEENPLPPSARADSVQSTSKHKTTTSIHWDAPAREFLASTRTDSMGRTSLEASARTSVSFVTARSHLGAPSAQVPAPSGSSEETNDVGVDTEESSSSKTHLVGTTRASSRAGKPKTAKSEEDMAKKTRSGLKSILSLPGKGKGKGKAVRYDDPTGSGGQIPSPPSEVLSRSADEVEDTSASAAIEATRVEVITRKADAMDSSAMRDRMLVRIFRCNHETIKHPFDEKECRTTRGLEHTEWGEFILVWRKHQIEIYENYSTPCKERFLGHKHLAFVLPLSTQTKLSLFSPVDFSFCLICPPTPTKQKEGRSRRSIFHRSSRGLNIFLLRPKSRSRAVDWIWKLWRELGGTLPPSFEVSCPLGRSRVSMPIPDTGDDWKVLTRDYIIDQCSCAMENSFAWQAIMQIPILSGRRLELCWRKDSKLDWVWLRDDVEGIKRDWEVIFGIALQQIGGHAQLELHLAEHYPTHIIMGKNGKHFKEPPAIEGYVYTMKRKTQVRMQHYLSTHDGYLCSILIDKVVPPPTPTDLKSFSRSEEEFREDEHDRLRTQILNARGLWDLRNVLVVRRASHVAQMRDELPEEETDGPLPGLPDFQPEQSEHHELRRSESDIRDEVGDHGMSLATDKNRVYRSFELVMKSGRIIRFETHSTKVTVEWVTHLRALVEYWKKRRRDDTTTEMNIIKENLDCEKITVTGQYDKHGHKLAFQPPDPESASQYMPEFWNWCVMDGCREIIRSGRMYLKSKLRGHYEHVHLVIVRGCLILFKATNNATMHYHQIKRINLIDAYVCSGYYAALALPQDEYDPNALAVAKIFQDGLETKDSTEDILFLLWYRPHGNHARGDSSKVPIQAMNIKHKVFFCRARSKLERDAWCWALNCEIEKLVRETRDRERRIREHGSPV